MKPRRVELDGSESARDAMLRVVATRLEEATERSAALAQAGSQELHQFRIACKRLRYALERCTEEAPVLAAAGPQLALVQDALGTVHDCDNLLARLPGGMPKTAEKLADERAAAVRRCAPLWRDAAIVVREGLRYYTM